MVDVQFFSSWRNYQTFRHRLKFSIRKMEPIDLSIGRLETTQKLSARETDHRLEERINQLELTFENKMKVKEREIKVLEIKIAHEMIDLKQGLNCVISEVTSAHQRLDNHEHEMKQLDLQKQALWARMDELRVQTIPLEMENMYQSWGGRFLGSIPDEDSSLIPTAGNENRQILTQYEKAQTPIPVDERVQRPINEHESSQIPNPNNENGEISILEEETSQSLTPDNLNTSSETSVITGERAGLAVKAVDFNNATEINTVEQESSCTCEAPQVNNPPMKSTFSCEICSKEFYCKISLRSHKIYHARQINKEHRKGIGSWKCIFCRRKFKYAKSCDHHESSCIYRRIEKLIPVSGNGNAESIPTTENLQSIFPDSGVENTNLGVISVLDSGESQMEVDSELHVPRRRGRGKTTHRSPNPLTRSSRNSNIENSPSLETTREILWKCVFCQKGFTYSSSYRDRHEMRCPNRNHQNGTSADSFVQSTLASSLMHGKNKRFNKNSLKCDVCAVEFVQKHHLRRHMLKHDPQNWKQCPYCTYRTHRIDNLTTHVRSMHSL